MFYPNGAVEDRKKGCMWAIGGMVGAKCCFICDMNQGMRGQLGLDEVRVYAVSSGPDSRDNDISDDLA